MNIASVNSHQGFTLIELLTVIAIIGILASVVLVLIDPVEQIERARDSGRRATLAELRASLDTYAVQHQGLYPSTCYHGELDCSDAGSIDGHYTDSTVYFSQDIDDYHPPGVAIIAKGDDWIPGLVSGGYIKALPHDPLDKKGSRICEPPEQPHAGYMYRSDGRDYKLLANCIVSTDMEHFVVGVDQTYNGKYCDGPWQPLNQEPKGRMVDPVRWNYAYSIYTPRAACWP